MLFALVSIARQSTWPSCPFKIHGETFISDFSLNYPIDIIQSSIYHKYLTYIYKLLMHDRHTLFLCYSYWRLVIWPIHSITVIIWLICRDLEYRPTVVVSALLLNLINEAWHFWSIVSYMDPHYCSSLCFYICWKI